MKKSVKGCLMAGIVLLAVQQGAVSAAPYDAARMEAAQMAGTAGSGADTSATVTTSQTAADTAVAASQPAGDTAAGTPAAPATAPSEAPAAAPTAAEPALTAAVQAPAAQTAEQVPAAQIPAVGGQSSESIPNPMVPYSSYSALATQLGFRPLIMTRATGYEMMDAYAIAGTTADLRYMSRYGAVDKRATFAVRTSKQDGLTAEALSGVYGYTWQDQAISQTKVSVAELSASKFAAFWQSGGYSFSVYAENLNRWDFLGALTDTFIDLTEHYYAPMSLVAQ